MKEKINEAAKIQPIFHDETYKNSTETAYDCGIETTYFNLRKIANKN